jgi:hypothetical protein
MHRGTVTRRQLKLGLASMLLAGACSSGNDQGGTGGAGGAGGMGGAGGGTTTPVTVTVMRNDNPPYVMANDEAF